MLALTKMIRLEFTPVSTPSTSELGAYYAEGDMEYHLQSNQDMLREILNYIESIEYSCECGLGSSIVSIKSNIENSHKVQELTNLCKDRTVAIFILGHMLELTTRVTDVEYQNPWDMAVVTYLYAITQARPELTRSATSAAWRLSNSNWTKLYIEFYLK